MAWFQEITLTQGSNPIITADNINIKEAYILNVAISKENICVKISKAPDTKIGKTNDS